MVLKNFVRSLSDDDLMYILFRLDERKSGDVGEAVEKIEQEIEIDQFLGFSKDAWTLYDAIDEIHEYIGREWQRRDSQTI